jgi:hypothetical protein
MMNIRPLLCPTQRDRTGTHVPSPKPLTALLSPAMLILGNHYRSQRFDHLCDALLHMPLHLFLTVTDHHPRSREQIFRCCRCCQHPHVAATSPCLFHGHPGPVLLSQTSRYSHSLCRVHFRLQLPSLHTLETEEPALRPVAYAYLHRSVRSPWHVIRVRSHINHPSCCPTDFAWPPDSHTRLQRERPRTGHILLTFACSHIPLLRALLARRLSASRGIRALLLPELLIERSQGA